MPYSPFLLHIFCLSPLTLKDMIVLLFKTNSSTCSLEHITFHLFKDFNPANYSLSNPNSSITTFLQAKLLNISRSDHCTNLLTVLFASTLVLPHLLNLFSTQQSDHVILYQSDPAIFPLRTLQCTPCHSKLKPKF